MLNADVLAVIQSYGLTSLDVADAVRELKREGVAVPTFKLRDLSKLCFIIQHKFLKRQPGKISYGSVQAGLQYEFLEVDRYVYLLAFKLLGFKYVVDPSFKFRIEATPLTHSVWCLNLRRMYVKEYGWCPFTLMEIVQSNRALDKQKILEMRVIRPLF